MVTTPSSEFHEPQDPYRPDSTLPQNESWQPPVSGGTTYEYPGPAAPYQPPPGPPYQQTGYPPLTSPPGYPAQPPGYAMTPAYPGAPVPMGGYPMVDAMGRPLSDKSKVVAGVLQLALGGFGAGRFYIGDNSTAVAQLVVTFLTCGIGHIWGIIDGIMILVNGGVDAQGRVLRD